MKTLLAFALVLCAACPIVRAQDTTDDTDQTAVVVPPDATIADLRQFVTGKQYAPGLQLSTRLLAAAKPGDRYDLLMLKAQCNLGMKNSEMAVNTFAAAAKAGKLAKDVTTALADSELVKHSPLSMYHPRYDLDAPDATDGAGPPPFNLTFTHLSPAPDPLDIVEPEGRPAAIKALFVDELQLALPDLKRAATSQTAPPVLTALVKLSKLRQLEMAGNGTDTQTAAMFAALASNAQKLMSSELATMTQQETACSRDLTGRGGGGRNGVPAVRGLTDADISLLQSIVSTCGEIITSCNDLPSTAAATFAPIVTQAQTVQTNATNLLNNIPMANAGNNGGNGGNGTGRRGRGGGGGGGGGGNTGNGANTGAGNTGGNTATPTPAPGG